MNFKLVPLKDIRSEITLQPDPEKAFKNILAAAKKKCPSVDWMQFSGKHLSKDITAAQKWIQKYINKLPTANGIYLGLDTLNMDKGKGTNVEIGLHTRCDPAKFSADWAFDCDGYGAGHLIKGIYLFEKLIQSAGKNESLVEYVIFLGYSGIVLREALLKVKVKGDFTSCWGFHDGDLFLLLNKIGQKRTVIANKRVN